MIYFLENCTLLKLLIKFQDPVVIFNNQISGSFSSPLPSKGIFYHHACIIVYTIIIARSWTVTAIFQEIVLYNTI